MKIENKYIIKLNKINLTYNKGKDNAFKALHNVSLKVEEGEFVVVFGPSGCGKSSLLNIIAGLEAPDTGDVIIQERNIGLLNNKEKVNFHRNKVGMVFQAYNLISTLDVLDNVALPQIFINENKKERTIRALEILDNFGIKEYSKKIPTELSGGQQQRVGIARAIVNNPLIVLADEPIGNLDTKSANNVMQILGDLNKKAGKTIILVSHNPENTIWGNHILHMKDGRIIKEEFKDIETLEEKTAITDRAGTESQYEQLANRFRGLSEDQISVLINPMKAKAIAQSLLISYSDQQIKNMENSITKCLMGKSTFEQLLEDLDQKIERGGAELDLRTAQKYLNEIKELVNISKKIEAENNADKKAIVVLEYFKNKEYLQENEEVMMAFVKIIKSRLEGSLGYEALEEKLDKELALDKRNVKKIIRRIDLIMLIGYGMKNENGTLSLRKSSSAKGVADSPNQRLSINSKKEENQNKYSDESKNNFKNKPENKPRNKSPFL